MSDPAAAPLEKTRARNAVMLDALRQSAEREWPALSWDGLAAKVETEKARVHDADSFTADDAPSRNNAEQSAFAIGCYRALTDMTGDKLRALDLVKSASAASLRGQIKDYLNARFQIDPEKPEEAFERIAERFKAGGEERFGQAFIYEQERQSDAESFINIRKCFFYGFMKHHGTPELTVVHCNNDAVWAEELEKAEYGVSFERPTLMSLGDDACRFQFTRKAGTDDQ